MMPGPPVIIRFGVFELDLNAAALSKSGRRLRLQEQPFRLLGLLLEQPGRAIARDELKNALWPADTFVDFDHSLNAAIAKLRVTLGDSAENPRFIETVPKRGYRFIAPVEMIGNGSGPYTAETIVDPPVHTQRIEAGENAPHPLRTQRKTIGTIAWILAVLTLVVCVAWWWQKKQPGKTELVKLTDDSGLTADPSVSPDGKLLAYASDRGSTGNLNIWLQQLATGGSAVQLTHDKVDASEPAFSPDGTKIAFHSKQDGGGIYLLPVIGGEASRLTRSGRSPRFSPDGHWIAYWSGGSDSVVPTVNGTGEVYLVPTGGGESRPLASDLFSAASPAWSPDGKHLLVYVSPKTGHDWDTADWWLVSLDGSASRQTGNFSTLKRQGFSVGFDRIPHLSQWTKDFITFSAGFGDAVNAWRAPVSKDGRIAGPAERLTSGTTLEIAPTLGANGDLLFASMNRTASVWSVEADPDNGNLKSDFKRVTDGDAEFMPSLSANGRTLVFTAAHTRAHLDTGLAAFSEQEASQTQTRVRDLSTNKETAMTSAATPQWHPQISRDGSMVAYNSGKPGQLYAASLNGGAPRMILGGSNLMIWDWSLDRKRLLFDGADMQIHSLDLQSGNEKLLLTRSGFGLYQSKFSPDDLFIALEGCHYDDSGAAVSQIFVVPIESGVPVPPGRWIAIDHPGRWDDKPRWSPSGNLLYFISDRDGYLCLWAQRFAGLAKKLVGVPFPVHHFHSARLAMANLDTGMLEIAVAQDKIIVGLGGLTGNVWALKRK
jgi:Tol biopolymer transport system component/DNA-binding winged helix-turn-helix (wHTH) protein